MAPFPSRQLAGRRKLLLELDRDDSGDLREMTLLRIADPEEFARVRRTSQSNPESARTASDWSGRVSTPGISRSETCAKVRQAKREAAPSPRKSASRFNSADVDAEVEEKAKVGPVSCESTGRAKGGASLVGKPERKSTL